MTVSAKFQINLVMSYSKEDELSVLTDTLNKTRGKTFSHGVGADQVNLVFHDTRPLADGENETLDFHDGSLTNKVGEDVTIDKLKAIYIKNNSDDSTLIIGNAASNQLALFGLATHTGIIEPKGDFLWLAPDVDGLDITSNAKLKFLHGGEGTDDPDYDIIIAGVDVA